MNAMNERDASPIEEMIHVAQGFLDLARWGFKESYRSSKTGNLIYDSKQCRVNLVWGGWDPLGGNNISIYYGRLHAPDEEATMTWNGEECYCWHRFEHALHFLDGRTPVDAVKLNFSHPLADPFYEDGFRQKFHRNQPEWLARMHVMVWENYGRRFFELFDLRRPDLWEQYRQFLKEYYDIEGRIPEIKPSLDKVC